MRIQPYCSRILAGLLAAITLTACGSAESLSGDGPAPDDRVIGLYTSLPILWNEEASLGDYLGSDREAHWALAQMREHGVVKALDTLAPEGGALPLGKSDILILAQPLPLSPQENVALDDWVNDGGHVLLFADPMLTGESSYALGDRRRPQDIVLLSPILTRWKLDLQIDESQPLEEREIALSFGPIPVNLPGRFVSAKDGAQCQFEADGLLADCRIGNGRVLAIADAAMLERGLENESDSRQTALSGLLSRIAP